MTIEGDYTLFAHLETRVPRRARAAHADHDERRARARGRERQADHLHAGAARPSPRADGRRLRRVRRGASSGAAIGVTTDAQASWWGGRGVGTVPHSLIAAYGGDTVLAATEVRRMGAGRLQHHRPRRLRERLGATALDVADALGPALWGVRLDTSGQLVDRSLWDEMGDFDPRGVNERLVRKVREALDDAGFERADRRLRRLHRREDRGVRAKGVPVDAYGVGSSLIRGENDFTADIVARRRQAVCEGRPPLPPEPAARACRVSRSSGTSTRRSTSSSRAASSSSPVRGDGARDGATRRVGAGARHRARRLGRRPRAHRSRDLHGAGLREHVPTPLPSRHARRPADPRDRAGRPGPSLPRRLSSGPSA